MNVKRAMGIVGVSGLVACIGDAPVAVQPLDSSTPDVTVPADGGVNDAVATSDVVDAGPPPCGAPGEACCVAPLAACGDGLTCSTGTKKCLVSEAWALGEYHTIGAGPSFVTQIVSAHFDGSTWTRDKDVVTDFALTSYHAIDLNQSPGGDVHAIVTKANISTEYVNNSVVWQECKLGNSCVGPSNKELQAMTAVTNSGNLEYWISATNDMIRCTASACTSVKTGIPGTWAYGRFAGTLAQDLWYSNFNNVFHFDGTTWKAIAVADAYTIGEAAPNDLWVGNKQLRHWDGTAWSNAFLVDGTTTPGTIYSIAGSGSKDVWAVGNDANSGGSFAAHWDGTTWTKKTLPSGIAHVERVYAPSPIDAFVVGDKATPAQTGVIAHWDGTAWTEMPSPKVTYSGETQVGSLRWYFVAGRARPRR